MMKQRHIQGWIIIKGKVSLLTKLEQNMDVFEGDRIANQFLINQVAANFDSTETIYINITNDNFQSDYDLNVSNKGFSIDLPGNELGLKLLEMIISDKDSRLYNASCIMLLNFQNMRFYNENTLRDILNRNYDVRFVMVVNE